MVSQHFMFHPHLNILDSSGLAAVSVLERRRAKAWSISEGRGISGTAFPPAAAFRSNQVTGDEPYRYF
ncbi:hypothetical protein [Phyllobacterium endophyticum]|nr:hypothetical protein [Phyllobacterium endophyticum]MBB3237089.1 hypothetical protein [Phyllobacterium endophyticum]TYR40558.1 hypothetical protein FY050_16725 [Phyllobacterium endophyticum]